MLGAGAMILIAGCCPSFLTQKSALEQHSEKVADARKDVAKSFPCRTRETRNGKVHVRYGIPDSSGREGGVLMERQAPDSIPVGESFQYHLTVHNRTDCLLEQLTVTENYAEHFTPKATAPEAEVLSGNKLRWQAGALPAGESKTFTVEGVATEPGDVKNCATVRYAAKLCTKTRAEQAELKLTKKMPEETLICDDIPIRLTVSNVGSGTARNVEVTDTLPNGLEAKNGKRRLVFQAGDLDEGESRKFHIVASAADTGTYKNKATARGRRNIKAEATGTVVVRAPQLNVTKSGTQKQYAGRPLQYTIKVTNTGDAAAENVKITDKVPDGMEFVSAGAEGKLSEGAVVWKNRRIGAGKSKEVSLKLRALQPGDVTNRVEVSGACAPTVADSTESQIVGVAATLLEVIDEKDPLEVGQVGTYVITVTNQGTAASRNVTISCNLEDNFEYVSSTGPTSGTVEGDTVSFEPLETLAAKDEVKWRVKVKAVKAGDVRFETRLKSNQLDRPVKETEATTVY